MSPLALIVPENFILATRDSGYKSLASALAELVDNAFEAEARNVSITIKKINKGGIADVHVSVADDGIGMDRNTLQHALQFGWSSRFNQRESHGRYGMGLPNASLSHARRVEVISSVDGKNAARVNLDVDEVIKKQGHTISAPVALSWPPATNVSPFHRGTVVTWEKCDRLLDRKLAFLVRKLRLELGRLFRYQLWSKKKIRVNDEDVVPFDPLFMARGANMVGAEAYGPELQYPITIASENVTKKTSIIKVRFASLPVNKWHSLSNHEKNAQGIAKNAGVTIVRAGREIDRGWFFMGQKRKENYDDWWRCEVRFEADLDEWFGVTHTKQEIHPTDELVAILSPELEKIARDLNGMARRSFVDAKADLNRRSSEMQAERFDNLIEPPKIKSGSSSNIPRNCQGRSRGRVAGLMYRLQFGGVDGTALYRVRLEGSQLTVMLNEQHPFVRKVWNSEPAQTGIGKEGQRFIELLIFAAARTESALTSKRRFRPLVNIFQRTWSSILATFLS